MSSLYYTPSETKGRLGPWSPRKRFGDSGHTIVRAEQKVQASLNLADRAFVLEMAASSGRRSPRPQTSWWSRLCRFLDGRGGNDFLRVAGWRNHLASGDCDRYHNYDQHQHNHYVFSRFTGPLKASMDLAQETKS